MTTDTRFMSEDEFVRFLVERRNPGKREHVGVDFATTRLTYQTAMLLTLESICNAIDPASRCLIGAKAFSALFGRDPADAGFGVNLVKFYLPSSVQEGSLGGSEDTCVAWSREGALPLGFDAVDYRERLRAIAERVTDAEYQATLIARLPRALGMLGSKLRPVDLVCENLERRMQVSVAITREWFTSVDTFAREPGDDYDRVSLGIYSEQLRTNARGSSFYLEIP